MHWLGVHGLTVVLPLINTSDDDDDDDVTVTCGTVIGVVLEIDANWVIDDPCH